MKHVLQLTNPIRKPHIPFITIASTVVRSLARSPSAHSQPYINKKKTRTHKRKHVNARATSIVKSFGNKIDTYRLCSLLFIEFLTGQHLHTTVTIKTVSVKTMWKKGQWLVTSIEFTVSKHQPTVRGHHNSIEVEAIALFTVRFCL